MVKSAPKQGGNEMSQTAASKTTSIRAFARHYAEMVIAMFAGMFGLGLPLEGVLQLLGTSTSELGVSAPALVLLGMGTIMTVPMVAWMRYRGHTWRPSIEMAASMFVPTFAVVGLMAGGASGFGAALMIEHVAMFPSMLAVMLLRWSEYATPHADQVAVAPASA
jgi:hypothetical protein